MEFALCLVGGTRSACAPLGFSVNSALVPPLAILVSLAAEFVGKSGSKTMCDERVELEILFQLGYCAS